MKTPTTSMRRVLVGQLYVTCRYSEDEILQALQDEGWEVSEREVKADIQMLLSQSAAWIKQSALGLMQQEVAKLDLYEDMVRQALVQGPAPGAEDPLDVVGTLERAEKVQYSTFRGLEILLKIAERRSRLLGMDAPKKLAVSVADFKEAKSPAKLTDQELERLLADRLATEVVVPQTKPRLLLRRGPDQEILDAENQE